jgi:pyridoxamine 5'-phosphate oxidase
MQKLHHIRKDYTLMELTEADIDKDPFKQFSIWLDDVLHPENLYSTAMVLSTVSEECRPSSRVVLLKDFSEQGFEFFSNYQSKKGKHLDKQAFASLLFFWPQLERQVRIEGKVVRLNSKESDKYFLKRPLESQISAWASPQSSIITNRDNLMDWYKEFESILGSDTPKRPSHWGGYRLVPDLFEFWQGREYRLHDRIEYVKEEDGWQFHRLAP